MSELNAKARAILDAARAGNEPQPEDQRRVQDALAAVLVDPTGGVPPLPTLEPAPAFAFAGSSAVGVQLAAVAALAAAVGFGGGLVVGRTTAPAVDAPLPVAEMFATQAAPAAPSVRPDPPPLPAGEAPPPRSQHAPKTVAPPASATKPPAADETDRGSTLSEEITLLRRAQRSLREGRADESLLLLDHIEQRFPSGVLQQERTVARILALCGAGRTDEARQLASTFLTDHPHSVHIARLQASCAAPGK